MSYKEFYQRLPQWKIGLDVLSLCLSLFVGGLLLFHKPLNFSVVDMKSVIAQRAEAFAKQQGTSATAYQIQELGKQLKEEMVQYAAESKSILLSKGAVVGGDLPDITGSFLPGGQS